VDAKLQWNFASDDRPKQQRSASVVTGCVTKRARDPGTGIAQHRRCACDPPATRLSRKVLLRLGTAAAINLEAYP